MLVLLGGLGAAAPRRWRETGRVLPLAWLAGAAGRSQAKACSAGTPLAALFWLVAGACVAGSALGRPGT